MHDWTGTRIRLDAETVRCRFCGAEPEHTCTQPDGTELAAFPAHTVRINQAQARIDAAKETTHA